MSHSILGSVEPFNGVILYDKWIHKICQVETSAGIRTWFQNHRYDPKIDGVIEPSEIDINWRDPSRNDPKIVIGKDIVHFGALGFSPIMTLTLNRHRWDYSEFIIPTREVLLKTLKLLGIEEPWLIFQQHTILNPYYRMKFNYDHYGSKDLANMRHVSREITEAFQRLIVDPTQPIHPLLSGIVTQLVNYKGRYIPIEYDGNIGASTIELLEKVYRLVNCVFFQYGKILVCKRKREQEQTYQGTLGDQYVDLKLLVDKASLFSEGRIEHGWDRFLEV